MLEKYEYIGKDARDNQWGHFYFGHKAETVKMYTVQSGSFSKKENAEKLFRKIKKAGFDAIVKKEDGQYKVQCGVFEYEKNAQSLVTLLKSKGFDAIIKQEGGRFALSIYPTFYKQHILSVRLYPIRQCGIFRPEWSNISLHCSLFCALQ